MYSRDGTMQANATAEPAPADANIDVAQNILRWEPWVRASLALTESMTDVTFSKQGKGMRMSVGGVTLVELGQPPTWFLRRQLPLVQSWAELRDEREAEILAQIDNQIAFIGAVTGLNATKHPWTMEWLSAGLQLCVAVEMRFKHALACPRPVELSPQVQPVITTPLHGSYPMGHAAQAFLVAFALQRLIGWKAGEQGTIQLQRLAARISINRLVAGVHFPIDAICGQLLGQTLGEYFVARSGFRNRRCNARSLLRAQISAMNPEKVDFAGPVALASDGPVTVSPSPVLHALAKLAQAEWWPAGLVSRIPNAPLN
jgi:hypothetical protein